MISLLNSINMTSMYLKTIFVIKIKKKKKKMHDTK